MKNFAQYLVETTQTFDYRIKIAGEVDKDTINELEKKLQQFDNQVFNYQKEKGIIERIDEVNKFVKENEGL